jgi:hypothetical protein
MLNRTRVDVYTSRLTDTCSIDFFGFDNENGIRKRLLALSSRELVGEDLDFDTEDTLTEEDMSGGRVDKVADLMISV